MVSEMNLAERIELVAQAFAKIEVRVHLLTHMNQYEVLFKHHGTTVWHEHRMEFNPYNQEVHEYFAPLIAHIKMTQP